MIQVLLIMIFYSNHQFNFNLIMKKKKLNKIKNFKIVIIINKIKKNYLIIIRMIIQMKNKKLKKKRIIKIINPKKTQIKKKLIMKLNN